ncbi:hypothetical protein LWF15_03825 [Kineosporia rhizophila]|uniref:hypothetical protein n=1 Tax=Kineosporia TaxID=49184 RepID=UPI001E54ADB6|nr:MULTISPECIES: hypothetical protein [Kineosporia]MCE0534628.1 hypothetical protein [Kineosporia rhizophila]GLY15581.1 hypothetical protein Kisp01_25960 [Kineosporia sp. NBRC 101677]
MDELSRLAGILQACSDKLEVLSGQVRADALFFDLTSHPDLAYLDAQVDGYYGR